MCKQHALRIAWTIARSIAFLDFWVLRWKFTYDWKCVNTTYRVPLFMPTACFPEGHSPPFTFCSFWRRRQRLEAVYILQTLKGIQCELIALQILLRMGLHFVVNNELIRMCMVVLFCCYNQKKCTQYDTCDKGGPKAFGVMGIISCDFLFSLKYWLLRRDKNSTYLPCYYNSTVKSVLKGHSKIDKTWRFMTNGSLMKVESIAECSPLEHSSILLTCI